MNDLKGDGVDTCYIIRPFRDSSLEKGLHDMFESAVSKAGMTPHEVTTDNPSGFVTEEIKSAIRNSSICLAKIMHDDPKVWLEVGYALGQQKQVLFIYPEERKAISPVAIPDENLLTYSNSSLNDLEELEKSVTARLKALIQKRNEQEQGSKELQVNELDQLRKMLGRVVHELKMPLVAIRGACQHLERTKGLKQLLDYNYLGDIWSWSSLMGRLIDDLYMYPYSADKELEIEVARIRMLADVIAPVVKQTSLLLRERGFEYGDIKYK